MRRAVLLVAALLAAAPSARAQHPGRDSVVGRCDSVPPSALRRVAVYVVADSLRNVPAPLHAGFRFLASFVARATDSLLGGRDGALPHGEPSLNWRTVGAGEITVTAYRDGRVRWVAPARTSRGAPPASLLLGRALDAVMASHVTFSWPSDLPGDSSAAAIHVVLPTILPGGQVHYLPLDRAAVPAFSMAMPPWTPVLATQDNPSPEYPDDLLHAAIEGTVMMRFVVDTAGRVEPNSAHDFWLDGETPPTGQSLRDYDEFRDAVIRVLPRMRFRAATIAGCAIRQMVIMPFLFKVTPTTYVH